MSNWSRTVDNALSALLITGIIVSVLAWTVILPTVGLLFCFGVL